MLWIAGKVSALNIMKATFLPCLVSIILSLSIFSFFMKGEIQRPKATPSEMNHYKLPNWQRKLIFFVGVGVLLLIPVFRTATHLPPYLGMLDGLSILWITTEIINKKTPKEHFSRY